MTNAEYVAFVRKHPISFGCGLLALLLAGALYYRIDSVPAKQLELERIAADGQRVTNNLKNSTQLLEHFATMTAAREQIEARLIRSRNLANNLQYFYKLEAETGTKLLNLRQNPPPSKAPPANALTGIGFSVSLQGEYAAILEALRRLETGTHYCRVMSATIATTGLDRSGPVTLTLSLELLGQP